MKTPGSCCDLLSASELLALDCTAQTRRPNAPLLVVERDVLTAAEPRERLSWRAPLTNAHAGCVKLHAFIDDRVIELYKDNDVAVISNRVHFTDEGSLAGARNLSGASHMLADVTAYTALSIWALSALSEDSQ
ncbi:hypothetical protein ABL78_2359 [Leptomonas seymouri]|uniref:Glycosyl hydrolase family 32 C-terminal domain-containing protein n=1 Tax=Leptomonas seymouri TaxID=5684 RepID=A0A0N0P7N0_LEPSE|nr:hypothetical protein ABL78_2359 [Leptomonas seymouri]|eukprot:KPI88547.1 hypothetical protein ABL78_2359 [Leptomonas seymouri]